MSKVAVITGGASGIGLAAANKLQQQGYSPIVLDVTAPPEDTKAQYYPCDVADYQQVSAAIAAIIKQHGGIHYLLSNAGVHRSGVLEDMPVDEIERIIDINLKGTLFVLKAILPQMRKQKFGRIVLNSSEQALVGKVRSSVYGATKAAIAQLAKSTALDYAQYNIRVNAVCPGTVDTPLYQKAIDRYCQKTGVDSQQVHESEAALQPLKRIGRPEDVANLIAFLFSDEADFITGANMMIDGGYTAQ